MTILTKKCLVCGKEFIKPKSCGLPEWFGRPDRPLGRRFCSKVCVEKSKIGKPSWNKGIPWTQDFREKIVTLKKGKHYSPKTEFKKGIIPWNKGKKGVMPTPWNKGKDHLVGEKHWNWKGGKTRFRERIMKCHEYKEWRYSILKRDDWTCVDCGARRKKGDRVILNVDHIKPYYKIIEENNIETVEQAKKCKELWDIKNGRTLCIPCHKQTPSYLVNQYTK